MLLIAIGLVRLATVPTWELFIVAGIGLGVAMSGVGALALGAAMVLFLPSRRPVSPSPVE